MTALTFAGRLLIFLTFLVGGGVFYACLHFAFFGDLPDGRYPIVLLLVPILLVAGAFFGAASLILGTLGIRIWKNPSE